MSDLKVICQRSVTTNEKQCQNVPLCLHLRRQTAQYLIKRLKGKTVP